MKNYFTIGEAAKAAHTTAETLRHYDRIGLVTPSQKDPWTNYRYYTKQDVVRLNTVRALQQMDLPLQKIKEILGYDDLEKIIAFLAEAERRADEKIAALQRNKSKIQAVKQDYETKLREQAGRPGERILEFPARVILLSDTLASPTLDNLWNYLGHFYAQVPEALRDRFVFDDLAGVYTKDGQSGLFAVCTQFVQVDGLVTLPAGRYLCANCGESDKEIITEKLLKIAENEYHQIPEFMIHKIVISGILKWNYQVQIYLDGENPANSPSK